MAFFALENLSQMHDGYKRAFTLEGKNLLLVQEGNRIFILENRCPHMDVPLLTADLLPGRKIRCRAHGIEFELENGRACGPLASTLDGLNKFEVVFDGNKIGVDL